MKILKFQDLAAIVHSTFLKKSNNFDQNLMELAFQIKFVYTFQYIKIEILILCLKKKSRFFLRSKLQVEVYSTLCKVHKLSKVTSHSISVKTSKNT